jgi:hypothetical protein
MKPGEDTEMYVTERFLMLISIVMASLRLWIGPVCGSGRAS